MKMNEKMKIFENKVRDFNLSRFGYKFEKANLKENEYSPLISKSCTFLNLNLGLRFKIVYSPDRDGIGLGLYKYEGDVEKGHMPLGEMVRNNSPRVLEILKNNHDIESGKFFEDYFSELDKALDTYLNDYITGKKFIPTSMWEGYK